MTVEISKKILNSIKAQRKEEGELPLLLKFYRKLVEVQLSAGKTEPPSESNLSESEMLSRLAVGKPLVSPAELEPHLPAMRDTFPKILAVFAAYPQLFGDLPEKLKKPGAGRLLTKKALTAWYTGKTLPPSLREGTTENLMLAVIHATVQPLLTAQANTLKRSIKQESWRRGYCPVCGGSPDIAYLEKEVGARWLVCSRCDFEWAFPRLECPFCRNNEQGKLKFYSDEEGRYRLHVCDNCHCYLKVIDLRKAGDNILLPMERLLTLDLDAQAKEHGYKAYQISTVEAN